MNDFLKKHDNLIGMYNKKTLHTFILEKGYRISYRYFCECIDIRKYYDLSFIIALYDAMDIQIDILEIFRDAVKQDSNLLTRENTLALLLYCNSMRDSESFFEFIKKYTKYLDREINTYIKVFKKIENEYKEREILEIFTVNPLNYDKGTKVDLKFIYFIYAHALSNNSNLKLKKILYLLENKIQGKTFLYIEKIIEYQIEAVKMQALQHEGNYEEVKKVFTAALEKGNKNMYANLGKIAFLEGDNIEALECFKKAKEFYKTTNAVYYGEVVKSYIALINGEYATNDLVKYSFPNIIALIKRGQKKEAKQLIEEKLNSKNRLSENEILILIAALYDDDLLFRAIHSLDLGIAANVDKIVERELFKKNI